MGNVNSGLISKEDFWKVKKKLFAKMSSNLSILDRSGDVLTDSQNTVSEYRKQMMHRWRKRLIRSDWKEFEGVLNNLCRQRLQKAKLQNKCRIYLKVQMKCFFYSCI